MSNKDPAVSAQSAISVKVGRWAIISATGWGVAALVVLAAMLLGAAVLGSGTTSMPHRTVAASGAAVEEARSVLGVLFGEAALRHERDD